VKADPGEARPVFGSVRVPCIVAASVACAASPSYSQIDLAAVRQAVRECVAQVRQDAIRRENYDQLGQPPMWRNFDAYVSPDGRVHNNARFVGEQEGVYRFEKCLAEHGFSIGFSAGASNSPPKPPDTDTCTQEELDFHFGDCWIKLSAWEKRLAFMGFEYGWIHSYDFAQQQEYERMGSSVIRFLANFDASKAIPYFDQLYSVQENRSIWWSEAFDLLFRTQINPTTKDIPGLTALYQKHEKPLFSGYLRKFVPPNKVVISEFSDAYQPSEIRNQTVAITLLSVSADGNSKAVTDFMAALLNVKQCNTLIRETEGYKYYNLKTDEAKNQAKQTAERAFYPQLQVVIEYPWKYEDYQEEFFNSKNEFSENILIDKEQSVCLQKEEFVTRVNIGQLMLDGIENKNEYSPSYLRRNYNDFINLNQYLIANGLRTVDDDADDPRQARPSFRWFHGDPAPDGVKKILTVGAAH
jgi:hypothetical protein